MKIFALVMFLIMAACAVEPTSTTDLATSTADDPTLTSEPDVTEADLIGPAAPQVDQCRDSSCRVGASGNSFCTTACGDVSVCAPADTDGCGPRPKGFGCCVML